MIVKGAAFASGVRDGQIIIGSIEHPSIHAVCDWLSTQGFEITRVPVDGQGFVDPGDVRRALTARTILVSVMHANNEIGTLEPVEEIAAVCAQAGVPYHTDACQSFTRTAFDTRNVSAITLNAHKIHGPKGVGALILRRGMACVPLLHGGGQERGVRSGTYNTPAIVGFGAAVALANSLDCGCMAAQRDRFITDVFARIDGVRLNGPAGSRRLCTNVNFSFDGVRGKRIFQELNRRGVTISTGSACAAARPTPSRVLLALGQDAETAHGAIRISLSRRTTVAELETVAGYLEEIVAQERAHLGAGVRA
jgi:cysteine desulfurase